MTIARAFTLGAAAAAGAIAASTAAAVGLVLLVDALARGVFPRALQRELGWQTRDPRGAPAAAVPHPANQPTGDDVRDRWGAH